MGRCKYGDPYCPCPDGDVCHYEGDDPWPLNSHYARLEIERLREAIDFAHAAGFEWPTDPYGPIKEAPQ